MNANFEYQVPTHIYFGDNQLKKLGGELRKHGTKVLMIYDSGWIKNTAWYPTVVEQIKAAGMELFEMGGVEPNPKTTSVNEAVAICKKEHIDVILAIGGGSVIDCAKLTSTAAFYDGDCWDFVTGKAKMEQFLPMVVISTISGTGSEMDAYGIVSNEATHDKLPFFNTGLFPTATFLDPSITYSVSPFQTACGAIDALSHYLEVYFMRPNLTVQLRAMEGFMKTIIEYIPQVMEHPDSYEARANIMWASSWALNGFTYGPTNGVPFMCHWIEDELSAKYNITHGLGLAIVLPNYLEYNLNEQSAQLYYEFGVNVLGIDPSFDPITVGKKSIEMLKDLFFNTCGLKSHLRDYGIEDDSKFAEMAEIACRGDVIHGYVDLTQQDAINILKMSL